MTIDERMDALLRAVRSGNEHKVHTINGAEQSIVDNAGRFRALDEWSRGKASDLVDRSIGWMQKQEVMRFLSTIDESQWQQALNLVEYCGTADLSFNGGVLNEIMMRAHSDAVPPEWIADEMLHDLKPMPADGNRTNGSNRGQRHGQGHGHGRSNHGQGQGRSGGSNGGGLVINKDALRRG